VKPYYESDRFSLYEGDCRIVLRDLSDCSVDSVVCDPPYELTANKRGGTGEASVNLNTPQGRARITTGFMGKAWDGSGVPFMPETWAEVLRVLKPGGHLLAFGGSRTYHRLACAIEEAGFEIRDQIQWLYGSGFPKSLDVSKAIDAAAGANREVTGIREYAGGHIQRSSEDRLAPPIGTFVRSQDDRLLSAPATEAAKQWNGWGTALKPAHEPIVLARKPLIGTVAENVLQHGTGGLNIDGCRVDGAKGNGNWRGACEQRPEDVYEGGWTEQRTEQNELGRWPANVITDGSDEVLAAFPDAPGQQGDLNGHGKDRLSKGVFGDMKAARDAMARLDSGSAARFFYAAKASQEDREEGLESLTSRQQDDSRKEGNPGGDNPRNRGLGLRKNHHPTVKPVDLMRYLCRLVTPPGGIVLDPFCGSGSTGKAAMLEGLKFIGIELSAEYCQLAQRRIEAVTKQGLLFATA
jgi:site-specific DNA-methyltransferase (adenine-specific)